MGTFYTPDEVDAILEEALKTQPLPGDMTRDQLEAVASEMGITPEDLARAEVEWRSARDTEPVTPVSTDQPWQKRILLMLVAVPFGMFLMMVAAHTQVAPFSMLFLILVMFFVGVAVRLAKLQWNPDRTEVIAYEKRMRLRARLGFPAPERGHRRGR